MNVSNLSCFLVILKEPRLAFYAWRPSNPYQDTSCLHHCTAVCLDLANVNPNSINVIILFTLWRSLPHVHNFWVQILQGQQQLERTSLVPRPPLFLFFNLCSSQKWKSSEKRGRPGNTSREWCQVDAMWMWEGGVQLQVRAQRTTGQAGVLDIVWMSGVLPGDKAHDDVV